MNAAMPRLLVALSASTLLLPGPLSAQDELRLRNDPAWRDISQPAVVVKQLQDIGAQMMQLRATGNRRSTRLVFAGPNSADKTLTAQLLGRHLGKVVYRVDLSSVFSKYAGETEKNLSRLFSAAESNDWILLFDEADALFGQRTNVKDAHDRYADQDVSYLLQRMEAYRGVTIITSNGSESPGTLRMDYRVLFAPPTRPHRPPGPR